MRTCWMPCLGAIVWALALPACFGEDDLGAVGVRIIRADELRPQTVGLRAGGVDRTHVVQVVCQVTRADGTVVTEARADVDAQASSGSQELRLRSVPADAGYFARLLGLDADGGVYECGASGPFEVLRGAKTFVDIIIDQPAAADPNCELLCARHADCPAEMYCPSDCVYEVAPSGCTDNLCLPDSLGAACAVRDDCGPGYACVTVGYPNGYCTASCQQDSTCPGRGVCNLSQTPGACVKSCETDGDCRAAEGYHCGLLSSGASACLPVE